MFSFLPFSYSVVVSTGVLSAYSRSSDDFSVLVCFLSRQQRLSHLRQHPAGLPGAERSKAHDWDGVVVATRSPAMCDYCVAETITGVAVLLQPFISILPSGRAVPVIMPVVLNGVATLPWWSRAITPPSPF